MKNLCAAVFALSVPFCAGRLHAEELVKTADNNENLHFGLTVGGCANTTLVFTKTPWEFYNKETKVGVAGGAYFEYDFAKRFFTHLEFSVGDRKTVANGLGADTAYGRYDINMTCTNINIPVGIGVRFFKNNSPFNVSLFAAAVVGLPQLAKSEIGVAGQNVDKKPYPVNIGAMLNLRVQYRFVFLDLRYEITGTPVFKYENAGFRSGAFTFMAGFQIF